MDQLTWKVIGAPDHQRGIGPGKDHWHSEEWIVGPARGARSEVKFRRAMPDDWDYSTYSEAMDAVEDLSDEWHRIFTYGHLGDLGSVYHAFDKEFVTAVRGTTVSDDWCDLLLAGGFEEENPYQDSRRFKLQFVKPGTKKSKVSISVTVKGGVEMMVRYSAQYSRFSYIVMTTATHHFAYTDDHLIPVYPPNDNILGVAIKFLVDVLVPHFQTVKIDVKKER